MVLANKINYLYFEELHSTNDKLTSILNKVPAFTVVYTHNQTKGKGYGGNLWETKAKKNLTFSFLLSLELDSIDNILNINLWVINHLHEFIGSILKEKHILKIKWPNDLILNKKKIAGLLIENKIIGNTLNCVVGIGLNVNQLDFNNLPKASSLYKETKEKFELESLMFNLMNHFLHTYPILLSKQNSLFNYFNQHLFMRDEVTCFKKNGIAFNGMIKKVGENGELCVLLENESLINFKHKEVILLF